MKLGSHFKLTSLELASLSLLAVGLALILVMLSLRACHQDIPPEGIGRVDSIAAAIDNAPSLSRDTTGSKRKRKQKDAAKKSATKTDPTPRHHLDETVNE